MSTNNWRRRARNSVRRAVSSNPILADAKLAKGKFSFIYKNSRQQEVPLKHCFHLLNNRATSESAIRALKQEFIVDNTGMVGCIEAGGLKIVVNVPEEDLGLVKENLLPRGKTESEAISKAFGEGVEWYGTADGRHVHSDLIRLETMRPELFEDFKSVVTIIDSQPISTLKAFSRARNMLQSSSVVKMTLYDNLFGIYEIAQERAKLSGISVEDFSKQRGSITNIADEYCGGSRYDKHTTRTLAGAGLRMKSAALETLTQIMNEEDPELIRRMTTQDMNEVQKRDLAFDGRAYKNITSTNTLRGATAFSNAEAQDQANALSKLKYSFENNGFKRFQASRLSKEADRNARALQ